MTLWNFDAYLTRSSANVHVNQIAVSRNEWLLHLLVHQIGYCIQMVNIPVLSISVSTVH